MKRGALALSRSVVGVIHLSYTYYREVTVGISSILRLFDVEVTPVGERIRLVKIKHTLGFISLVVVYSYRDE